MSDYYKHVLTYDAGSNTWKPKTLSFTSVAYGVKPEGWDIHGYRSDGYYNHGTRVNSPTGAGFHQAVDDSVFYHYVYDGSIDSVSPYPQDGYNSFGYTVSGVISGNFSGFPDVAALDDGYYYQYTNGFSSGLYTGFNVAYDSNSIPRTYIYDNGVRSEAYGYYNTISGDDSWYFYDNGFRVLLENNDLAFLNGKYRIFQAGVDVGYPSGIWPYGERNQIPSTLPMYLYLFDGNGGGSVIEYYSGYYRLDSDSKWYYLAPYYQTYALGYGYSFATGVGNANGTNLWYVFDGAGGATLASGMLLCNDGKYRSFNSNGTFKEYPSGQITLDNGDIVTGDGAGGLSFPYNHQYSDVTLAYWWDNSTLATGNSVYTSQHGNTKANSVTFYLGEDGVAGFTKVITDSIGVATVTAINHPINSGNLWYDNLMVSVGNKVYIGQYTLTTYNTAGDYTLKSSGVAGFGIITLNSSGVVTVANLVNHSYADTTNTRYVDSTVVFNTTDNGEYATKVYAGRYTNTMSGAGTYYFFEGTPYFSQLVVDSSGLVASASLPISHYWEVGGYYHDEFGNIIVGETIYTGQYTNSKAINLTFTYVSSYNYAGYYVVTNSSGVVTSVTAINHQYSYSSVSLPSKSNAGNAYSDDYVEASYSQTGIKLYANQNNNSIVGTGTYGLSSSDKSYVVEVSNTGTFTITRNIDRTRPGTVGSYFSAGTGSDGWIFYIDWSASTLNTSGDGVYNGYTYSKGNKLTIDAQGYGYLSQATGDYAAGYYRAWVLTTLNALGIGYWNSKYYTYPVVNPSTYPEQTTLPSNGTGTWRNYNYTNGSAFGYQPYDSKFYTGYGVGEADVYLYINGNEYLPISYHLYADSNIRKVPFIATTLDSSGDGDWGTIIFSSIKPPYNQLNRSGGFVYYGWDGGVYWILGVPTTLNGNGHGTWNGRTF